MPAPNFRDNAGDHSTPGPVRSRPAQGQAAPLGSLRQFMQKRERKPLERCELCNEAIPENHRHLLAPGRREVICACQACSLLFSERGAAGGKYLLIPNRYLALTDFQMSDEQWESLAIPVNMVYIFRTTKRVMAFYPSPAGATESLLELQSWEELVGDNPVLHAMEPDVEALLINRVRSGREYYIVPIDACYQLVGLIRLSWRGLSGGEEVWRAIADFFAGIKAKAEPRSTVSVQRSSAAGSYHVEEGRGGSNA